MNNEINLVISNEKPFIKDTVDSPSDNLVDSAFVESFPDAILFKDDSPVTIIEKSENVKQLKLAKFVSNAIEKRKKLSTKNNQIDIEEFLQLEKKVEQSIFLAESEIFYKRDVAFYLGQDNQEILEMKERHAVQLQALKNANESLLKDRMARNKAKEFRAAQGQQRKLKDKKLQNQQLISRDSADSMAELSQYRENFALYLKHLTEKNQKKLFKLKESQHRKSKDKEFLFQVELESLKHLNDVLKSEMIHNFQCQANNQKVTNKKVSEQEMEIHALEIRNFKVMSELELKMIEETNQLKLSQLSQYFSLEESLQIKVVNLKKNLMTFKDKIKVVDIEIGTIHELQELIKIQIEIEVNLKKEQLLRAEKRKKKWELILGEKKEIVCAVEDKEIVENGNLQNETESINNKLKDLENYQKKILKEFATAENYLKEILQKNQKQLSSLSKHHQKELSDLEATLKKSITQLENQFEIDFKKLKQVHAEERELIICTNMNELKKESEIKAAETLALCEKKSLAALLDTMSDGVITLNARGIVERYNMASEKMFGFKNSEVIGKNISMLMDNEISKNHDKYIYNYLSTGKQKVVGKIRQVMGKRKNNTLFPMDLSVTEVVGDGFHIFSSVFKDLTEILREKETIRAEEEKKTKEMKAVLDEVTVYQNRSTKLLEQMLPGDYAHRIMSGETPPPQSYDTCTIFFSDIVGFTSISAACSAMEVVNLLNDLYTFFDAVIDKHGTSYHVVSGVPNLNGDEHAAQIADMALKLLSGIHAKFTVRHTGNKLQIRIGLHTGPCVSGIVGTKMPRYCLFGKTVTFASQMESTSSPMRIQISEPTYQILKKTGDYIMEERDELVQMGKGITMKTYWLSGKKELDIPLPKLEDWPVIGHQKG
ncbi:hypothetical protein HK099_003262 [Clydaea vesicula]|uniref:Guanylate cyclase n=1 Tax=Clydaea vesicula TaxID=447962 RepID=A0AAD5XYY1_9FUNG|nr:hypothetical protein HK099_003262 [Clydaea vesicula]